MTAIVAVEIPTKAEQLKEGFYRFFFAEEKGRRIRYEMNLKLVLKDGKARILSGKFIGFVPDKFHGKDEAGSWIEIPLSGVADIAPVPKKI